MKTLKQRSKRYANQVLVKSGALEVLDKIPWPRNGLIVLTYHRLSSNRALYERLLSVPDLATFERQMEFLARRMNPIDGRTLLAHFQEGEPLPPRAVLVTFDDAYRDFLEDGWPIMKRRQVPAVLFVPTAYPSGDLEGFWWDRLAWAVLNTREGTFGNAGLGDVHWHDDSSRRMALERIRAGIEEMCVNEGVALVEKIVTELAPPERHAPVMCNWDELRTLAAEGVMMGAHTRSHAILGRLTVEQASDEITASREDLKRQLGHAPLLFCYPNGLRGTFNEHTEGLLRKAGFVAAFVSLKGFNDPRARNLFQLRRVGVNRNTTAGAFRVNLLSVVLRIRQKVGLL